MTDAHDQVTERIFPFVASFRIPEASGTDRAIAAIKAEAWETAYRLLNESVSHSPSRTLEVIGDLHASGFLGERDMASALRQWERAATKGNADAAFKLADALLADNEVERDCAVVVRYLWQAVRRRHPHATEKLGVQFLNGDCVPQNIPLGVYFLLRASTEYAQQIVEQVRSDLSRRHWAAVMKFVETMMWVKPVFDGRSEQVRLLRHSHIEGELAGQGRPNPSASGGLAKWSPAETLRAWCEELSSTTPDLVLVVVLSERYASSEPELLRCSVEDLWHLAEPGDGVFLSDGVVHHHSRVIEKTRAVMRFVDPWPEDFLLLDGRNAIGAGARLVEEGDVTLVEVTREDFLRSCVGVAHFATAPLRESRVWDIKSIAESPHNALSAAFTLCLHYWRRHAREAVEIAQSISQNLPDDDAFAASVASLHAHALLLSTCLCDSIGVEGAEQWQEELSSGMSQRWAAAMEELDDLIREAGQIRLDNIHAYHTSVLARRLVQAGGEPGFALKLAMGVIAEERDGILLSTPQADRVNLLAYLAAAAASLELRKFTDGISFASIGLMYVWPRRQRPRVEYPFGAVYDYSQMCRELLRVRMASFAAEKMHDAAIDDAVSLVEWNLDVKAGLAGLDEYLRLSKRENTGNDFVDTVLEERRSNAASD